MATWLIARTGSLLISDARKPPPIHFPVVLTKTPSFVHIQYSASLENDYFDSGWRSIWRIKKIKKVMKKINLNGKKVEQLEIIQKFSVDISNAD